MENIVHRAAKSLLPNMFIKLLLAIVDLRKLRSNFLPLLLYLALFLFDKFGLSTFKTEDSFNALSEYDTRERKTFAHLMGKLKIHLRLQTLPNM